MARRTKEKRWILRVYFTNSEEVRNFMKQFKDRIEGIKGERFGRRGSLGIYTRHFVDPGKLLVIISGHIATDLSLEQLAKEIRIKIPNAKTEVVPIH
jgi:hypothetical protein